MWTKPLVHEALATLYLRLNGYFTTGLILPSPKWGRNRGELDCLAIRHPNHAQPERCVETSKFLAVQQERVDLIICEVKSSSEQMEFNKSLRNDPECILALLRWAGVFSEEKIKSVASRVKPLLQSGADLEDVRNGVMEDKCRVRTLLCCPPLSEVNCADRWWLVGSELFDFVNRCFNPTVRRSTSSTRYDFELWGYALAPLVKYFKDAKESRHTANLSDLYVYLKVF
ncbi:MAG: hypothetical protein WAJ96_03610 [Candidatus Acidiferrum sp.]